MQFSKVKMFWRSPNYIPVAIQEARVPFGYIYVLVERGIFSYMVVDSFLQVITFRIEVRSKIWYCSAVYGSPTPSCRSLLWDSSPTGSCGGF